jgi:hypothetical protein
MTHVPTMQEIVDKMLHLEAEHVRLVDENSRLQVENDDLSSELLKLKTEKELKK